MSPIPEDIIHTIRDQTDIVELLSEYVSLKKSGSNYKALCPFHNEKTPSFMVSPSKQIFHCFGCGTGGNAFTFLMKHEGFSFIEAVRYLANRMGIALPRQSEPSDKSLLREKLLELNRVATQYYQRRASEETKVRDYLARRDIQPEMADAMGLGYATADWDDLHKALRGRFSEEVVVKSGLVNARSSGGYYDLFRNRLIFPIWGITGDVVAFGGRALEDGTPKYINSPETPVYQKGRNLYGLHRAKGPAQRRGKAVIVEGYIDLIRLYQVGIENAVASLGTAFTPEQARLLRRYVPEAILVYDSDQAGLAAASRGVGVLLEEDLIVKVVVLPSAKDPDEFIRTEGVERFSQLLNGAKNFIEFHLEKALSEGRARDVDGKVAVARELLQLITKMPSELRQDGYLKLLSESLSLEEDRVRTEFTRLSNRGRRIPELRPQENKVDERGLIGLLMHQPDLIERAKEAIPLESYLGPECRRIAETLYSKPSPLSSESELFDSLKDEGACKVLSEVLMTRGGDETKQELEDWILFMRKRLKKKEDREARERISAAEKRGDWAEVREWLLRTKEIQHDLERLKTSTA